MSEAEQRYARHVAARAWFLAQPCAIEGEEHPVSTVTGVARKHTRFQTCERHAWLMREGRHRRAEFFAEGGPAGQAGCQGGLCRLWPGRDLFIESECFGEMALDWTEGAATS